MNDDIRRCALPGCDTLIEPTPGRPERRYCTAAHRAAARQARRASAHVATPETRLAEALPWVAEHETAGPRPVHPPLPPQGPRPAARRGAAVALAAPPPARPGPAGPGRMTASLPRRRRALAVLAAAGIIAGGYAVTGGESHPAEVPPAQALPGGTESQWAARAEIALASVTRQLDTIADVEAAWSNTPESMRAGAPAEVRALQERKDVLERRRVILRSQLDMFAQRQEVETELRAAEQRLRDVERQLQDVPSAGRRSPQQQAEIAALEEHRALQIQRRDAKRAELAGLTEGVESATRVPLPDDSAKTAAVSEDVREVIEGGGEPAEPGDDTQPPRTEVVGGRDQEGERPRADTHTSAPPDPRGPRDESRGRDGGPVETVTDTVDGVTGVLTGGDSGDDSDDDSDGDRGRGNGRGGDKGDRDDREDRDDESDGGVVGTLGDTVDDTTAGLTGVLGGGSDDERDQGAAGRDEGRAAPEGGSDQVDRVEESVSVAPAAQERSAPRVLPAPAPSAPADIASSSSSSASSTPSSDKRISPEEAAMARAVVRSVPGGQWAAPALEAAIAQQEREDAAASPSSRGDSGSRSDASDSDASDSDASDSDASDSGSSDSGSSDAGSSGSESSDSGSSDSGSSDFGSSDFGSSDFSSSDLGSSDSGPADSE